MISATAKPSSSALWANMGPNVTSPIQRMLGTLVLNSESITTRPRLSTSMPTLSRPRPSVNGRRPTETRTTSASNWFK
ncbi:hypothetical protein BC937DRAFT_95359 [Endogone sp. FLAS-F59071]|nr:hypothetical protein BC937DRAFT_95359 [Endogone sp. FLAS-F59071]|eukprot:RUS20373.1 hypothetical protein BC937DRAFT_95359 [Endogone sp. FLAS-F59071]